MPRMVDDSMKADIRRVFIGRLHWQRVSAVDFRSDKLQCFLQDLCRAKAIRLFG